MATKVLYKGATLEPGIGFYLDHDDLSKRYASVETTDKTIEDLREECRVLWKCIVHMQKEINNLKGGSHD